MKLMDFLRAEPPSTNGHVDTPTFGVYVPPELTEGWPNGTARLGSRLAWGVRRSEALKVPAVLRGRNLICGTLSTLPIHIRDSQKRDAAPTSLLDQIDPDVPNVVTFASTFEDLLFDGVAWWRVLEVNARGFPSSAEWISGDRVHVGGASMPGERNGTVFVDGRPVPDNSVIRFDSPNPPVLKEAARAIRTCLMLDQTAAMYADEPMPLGYFSPRDPAQGDADDEVIQAKLDAMGRGAADPGMGVCGGGLDGRKMQFDAEQIQLADQRQHAVLEIARAMGIDPERLGVSTTSRTYKNIEQERQDFIDFTLSHYMVAVEQRLSMRDVLPRGYRAKYNLDGFLRSDTLTRMQAYQIGAPLGVYTEDEMRDLEDRPPLGDSNG